MLIKVLTILILITKIAAADVKSVSVGILPGGNPQAIEKESYLLAEKLQNKLNIPVQIFVPKNYDGMISLLKNKKIDLAVLSAMTYVMAEKEVPVKVLLKKTWSNGPFYYSAIVVNFDSKIKSIKDLKNKRIAFVDEKSTSGYLYPQIFLKKKSITNGYFKSISFSGNHAASVQLLESNKVDAIAVFADDEKALHGAWGRFAANKKIKVRVLWVSEPIPNDPIVVRQSFYDENPKLTHEIMYNLIETQNESTDKLSETLGTSDLMPATSKQYDPVREMVKSFEKVLKL